MKLTNELRSFITMHANDDPARLLLSASRYPGIDVPFAVEQIQSRRQIRDKLPSWYINDRLIFPARIAAEQCSSEQTALYKQRLVEENMCVCDLTGGLGIDSYFFSRKVKRLFYMERFPTYCEAARSNFSVLGADNIEVMEGDSAGLIDKLLQIDVFYVDPARRGEGNKRVFALQDCEPDLPALLPELFRNAPRVVAKLSPMADIRLTIDLLPGTTEVHVLSIKNECKELLFVIERNAEKITLSPKIHCVNFIGENKEEQFSFTLDEEQNAEQNLSMGVGTYLYEPNASLLKAGAFKCLASRLGVGKLHVSSHLYTSLALVRDFPGRTFIVREIFPFNSKLCKGLSKQIPQANITVRNFPLTVEELRKRTHIADGGEVYIFATTISNGEKVIIKLEKIQ